MSGDQTNTAFQVHDLRSKISAAVSFIELLERELPQAASSQYTQSLKECLQGAIVASQEVSLALSVEDSAAHDSLASKIKLASAKEVASVHAPEAYAVLESQYPIEIQYSCKVFEGEYFVAMQAREIASIRENVVTNAVASGATKLSILYEMKEYGLRMVMSDNGKGMSQDELDRLRLLRLGDGRIHGLGTRRIFSSVDAHDAAVTYDSVVGQGTTVTILCPYVCDPLDIHSYEIIDPALEERKRAF